MDKMDLLDLGPTGQGERSLQQLAASNEITAPFGIRLSGEEMTELAVRHAGALRDTGRIEFGEGIWKKLALAFCDSPFITPREYARVLGELMEMFYEFKGDSLEQVGDDEMIAFMKEAFDSRCQGSLEYLRGTLLEGWGRRLRGGGGDKEEENEE